MAVKDLVGIYESKATSPSSPSRLHPDRNDEAPRPASSSPYTPRPRPSQNTLDIPAPSPARFVAHPLLRRREPSGADQEDDLILPDPSISEGSSTTLVPHIDDQSQYGLTLNEVEDADVTDELVAVSGRHQSIFVRGSSRPNGSGWAKSPPRDDEANIELETLLHKTTETASFVSSTQPKQPRATSSTITLVPPMRVLGDHTPVPLSQILARNAAPVSLPQLDQYLSTLEIPQFQDFGGSIDESSGKGKGKASMFPPMDRLQGQNIADLEHNTKPVPAWRDRQTIFSALTNTLLGITGSSAIASFYSVQGLVDTLQIFALLLSTFLSHGARPAEHFRTLMLQTVPNILAFNFASSLVQSLVLLAIFMVFAGLLLYFFMRMTAACCSAVTPEGLQPTTYLKNSWAVIVVTFVLTVIYLPLSTMAVHVLVWSDDLWAVDNPYTNATTFPPVVAPLGPPDEYRDPLDFCYTTTMLRNEINYAPAVMILALTCFAGLTVWYPIHLYRTIRRTAPKVDAFTELGTPRSQSGMDLEYQRLLDRDSNPLVFLYGGFRRGWAAYESMVLLAKVTTLLLTAVIDPDNCWFRNSDRDKVAVARQILLCISMLSFFILQCIYAPFLDPVNNANEWFSRLNYVLTSVISLAVAFDIPGEDILDGPVLYAVYIVTYGLSFYFTFIHMSRIREWVKTLSRRIDFSIDIFSPRMDISPNSSHTKRRIWQEAITTLLLTDEHCHIPKDQKMVFKQARDSEYPPYLLSFQGTPAERHVENLKILREVGALAYNKAVKITSGPDRDRFQYLEDIIQNHFTGPDCYWKPEGAPPRGCTRFFGNAFWIPFPPTLVLQYDDGPQIVLNEVTQLDKYVHVNSSEDIMRKRQLRMALRSLDGQIVRWPYDHIQVVGNQEKYWCCGRRYAAQTHVHYRSAKFSIKHSGHTLWEGVDLGSGFDVQLDYAKDVTVPGVAIGLTDDYDLNKVLAHFLAINESLIPSRLSYLEAVIHNYRRHFRKEAEFKKRTLSYTFLTHVYSNPREPVGAAKSAIHREDDARVRRLMSDSVDVLSITYDRWMAASSSEIATWWYILWDDFWRRNWNTINGVKLYASDFNPHYPTSIAYTPLPRAALENFLTQRGLLHTKPKSGDFFHAGFLNKIYLRMNDIAYQGSDRAIIFHLGDETSELDMEEVDQQTLPRPSTLGTGDGTEYDDASIRARPTYRWEGIFDDPVIKCRTPRRRFISKLAVWFGISPHWLPRESSHGLSLDVRLENGKYVLLDSRSPGVSALSSAKGMVEGSKGTAEYE
ncbi:uncharacterized protein BXZ73DRAFT_39558 [Epithele typhae]|uniref:uncharacterized protein n=1 Tax=Epithele typhae TaxID=378194 RepID=UPI002007CEB1|nr:uncharacterized protein BXZ73DRAFT_39558 [Epithele typhae]KAH9944323.1 hypothetical protein BXZ73DRAFT_39558 [Epithele typhae]